MGRPYKCPNCGSKATHWKEYRRTSKGLKRIRKCRACNRKFTTRAIIQLAPPDRPSKAKS